MKRALLILLIVIAALLAYALFRGRTAPSEAERNSAFAQSMSGVTLVGHSTRQDREGLFGPERYHIEGITHMSGDTWLFRVRMNYDGKEIPVPIPLTVEWAGGTPVITLTDLAIPGVGTWTARVLLYGGQYAGTWSGEKSGGQMFGKIVRGNAP